MQEWRALDEIYSVGEFRLQLLGCDRERRFVVVREHLHKTAHSRRAGLSKRRESFSIVLSRGFFFASGWITGFGSMYFTQIAIHDSALSWIENRNLKPIRRHTFCFRQEYFQFTNKLLTS